MLLVQPQPVFGKYALLQFVGLDEVAETKQTKFSCSFC